jgi:hypothetical protein
LPAASRHQRSVVRPRWLAPAIEATLLVPLSIATAWTQVATRKVVEHDQWSTIGQFRVFIRRTALVMTGVISIGKCGSLIFLVRALLEGHAGGGATLLVDALNIWVTNVIVFALWFWNTDRAARQPAAWSSGLIPTSCFRR